MHHSLRGYVCSSVIVMALCSGCGNADEPVASLGEALSTNHFEAVLSGDGEVPPNDTKSRGTFVLDASTEGELSYRLVVANIEDVIAAHIHCGPVGVNARIGVTLFMGGPIDVNGTLAEGTVTAPDPNNACGWLTIDDVIAAILAGNAYVNVHTTAFPRGQIRGQLE
jgi:hypothetical protein